MGNGEIWVQAHADPITYVAPTLLVHYVEWHEYSPPEDFINALMH